MMMTSSLRNILIVTKAVLLFNSFIISSYAFVIPPHGRLSTTVAVSAWRSSSLVIRRATRSNDEDRSGQEEKTERIEEGLNNHELNRKDFFTKSLQAATTIAVTTPREAFAKCTDIETCREIGEKKVEQEMIENPTIRLDSGVRYKVLQPGVLGGKGSNEIVQPDSNIDLIFSVSTLSGGYMYSRGFGFEKIDIGDGNLQSDVGLDSLRVRMGQRDVPVGIEDALVGMRKGERRRVELPPRVGFETSEWKPEPTTRRGKTRIVGYKQLLEGNGSSRPPFPAATIWDVEVLKIRN